jgi:hypothetical protein
MKGEWSNPAGSKKLVVDMMEQLKMSDASFENLRPPGARKISKIVTKDPKKAFRTLFENFDRDKSKILALIFPKEVASSKATDAKNKHSNGDCRPMYAPEVLNEDILEWELNQGSIKVWTDYPQAFRACNIKGQIEAKMLTAFVGKDGPLSQFAQPLPIEVVEWKKRHEECQHWAGEEPYDKERAHEIETAVVKLKCSNLSAEADIIRKKYGSESREGVAVKGD